jgi:hypothetical protein
VVIDKKLLNIVTWFSSPASGPNTRERLYELGIRKEVADSTMDFLEGCDDNGGDDCLVVVARLLANNHVPPKGLQPEVRLWFTRGPGMSLYCQLQNNSSIDAEAFIEKVNQLEAPVEG